MLICFHIKKNIEGSFWQNNHTPNCFFLYIDLDKASYIRKHSKKLQNNLKSSLCQNSNP